MTTTNLQQLIAQTKSAPQASTAKASSEEPSYQGLLNLGVTVNGETYQIGTLRVGHEPASWEGMSTADVDQHAKQHHLLLLILQRAITNQNNGQKVTDGINVALSSIYIPGVNDSKRVLDLTEI